MKVKVELTFPRELKNEPVIYQIITRFNVVPTILEASFTTKVGWVYLIVEGEESELKQMFDYLESRNVIVDKRS